jgi:hypothetical protein
VKSFCERGNERYIKCEKLSGCTTGASGVNAQLHRVSQSASQSFAWLVGWLVGWLVS